MLTVRLAGKADYGISETSAAAGRQRPWRLLGLVLVLLAFGLRVHDLDAKSIWLDEALSFHRAATLDRAVSGLMVTAGVPSRDTQPPLYFVLLYGLLSLAGASDFPAKFLSVFFSTLLVPVLAVAGFRLGGRRAGLIAGILGAVSPLYVWYAQEVRMYALLAFFAGLVIYLGLRSASALGQGDRKAGITWVSFTVLAAVLGILTQYVAVFIVPAVGFGLAAALLRRKRLPALLGFGLLAVAGPAFLVDAAWDRIITLPTPQFDQVPVPVTLRDFIARAAGGLALEGPALNGLTALFAVLVALGLARGLPRPDRWWLFGTVIIPPLATALVGAQKPLISNVRHLIFATPALYLAAALGVDFLSRRARWAALGVTGVLLAGALVSLAGYFDPNFQKDDFRSLVEYLQANAGPDDLVLVHEATVYHVFEHYDGGYLRVETLPRFGEAVGNRLSPELEARLRELQSSYRRIWLVYWPRSIAGDPAGLVPGWFDAHLFPASDRAFAGRGMGVAVRGYVTSPAFTSDLPTELQPANLTSADGLRILGWQAASAPTADGRVELAVYFRADRQPLPDYRLIARLVDDRDHVWAAFDGRPIPAWPTGRWPAGQLVRADVLLRLEPGAPPGSYRLEVGLAPDRDETPVPLIGPAGAPAGTMVGVGQVQTPGAYRQRPDFDRAVPKGLSLACQCGLRILDLFPGTRTVLPGQTLTLRGYYRLVEPKDPGVFRLAVELRRDGLPAATGSWPLLARLPDGLQTGDWLAGAYDLLIPVGTPAGEYRLVGRVLGPGGAPESLYSLPGLASPEVDLGTIQVAAPDRELDRPSPSRPAEATFGSLLQLEGYDLEPAGPGWVRVTLYWRVLGRSEQKLKVSVQFFDGQRLVAQDDGVPVNWTRPASTWVPGEYLTDPHDVALPPGTPPKSLTMLVIVYDEATGQRVPVAGPDAAGEAAQFAVK